MTNPNLYSVPEDWQAIYAGGDEYKDFEGDAPVYIPGPFLGWKTPDGFISPDKLPPQYKTPQLLAQETLQAAQKIQQASPFKFQQKQPVKIKPVPIFDSLDQEVEYLRHMIQAAYHNSATRPESCADAMSLISHIADELTPYCGHLAKHERDQNIDAYYRGFGR